jgi:hypothetical protein
MRILDKHKDFYDHLAGVYGIDNTVFFDRRGSTKLAQSDLLNAFLRYDRDWFYEPETIVKRIQAGTKDIHAIVEAGYFQYLLRITSLTIKSLAYPLMPEVDGAVGSNQKKIFLKKATRAFLEMLRVYFYFLELNCL